MPMIVAIDTTDRRDEAPHRLATIRGGFGMPIKILNTEYTVSQEIGHVFAEALAERGLIRTDGGSGGYDIHLIVHRFDAGELFRRAAHIDLDLHLIDHASGGLVYADHATDDATDSLIDVRMVQIGVFASVDRLQAMAETELSAMADRMLDKPAFRQLLARNTTPQTVSQAAGAGPSN